MYKLIDLFCGAGGMSLGFVDPRYCGEFECVLALDNDRASIETHAKNIRGKAVLANIEDWLKSKPKIPNADVVIGGPPCQGFSLLNKNRDGDERRALWEPYLEVVAKSGARVFVMENVAELYRSPELKHIVRRAKRLGFLCVSTVVNAADYGTPQVRRRTLILGVREDVCGTIAFPPVATHAPQGGDPRLKLWRTVRDAIGDLPSPVGTEIRVGEDNGLDLHFGRTPTAKSMARYRAVPPGGNRFDLQKNAPELTPACWVRKTSGGTDLFGRLWWDRPSVTIRTEFFKPEKGRYLHPEEHRPITHKEAARLMGFPDSFKFCGSKIEIARQIGNAVPPDMAGAIARSVAEGLAEAGYRLLAQEKKTEYA